MPFLGLALSSDGFRSKQKKTTNPILIVANVDE